MMNTLRPFKNGWIVLALLLALISGGWGIWTRLEARAALAENSRLEARIQVETVHPLLESKVPDLMLPGQLQAWTETPIYAHTNGYLKRWLVDIGQPVKQGQLIAEISTPEIDQQEIQAKADLASAQANARLASVTAQRYRDLLPTHTVSPQDVDNKQYDAAAKEAIVASAKANLERLHQLDVYKRIEAPVDGIITARNVDLGTMIDSGSSNGRAQELFHLSSIRKLRAYVSVPESEAGLLHEGTTVFFSLRGQAGKKWSALLMQTAHAVDPVSHTQLVELQLDNPNGQLLPGSYIEVTFPQMARHGVVSVPSNALIFRAQGTQVAVVDEQQKVHLVNIQIGRDMGSQLEILDGLSPTESVIVSPPDFITEDQVVVPHAHDPNTGSRS